MVSDSTELDAWALKFRTMFGDNSPTGMAASKAIIQRVAGREIDAALITATAHALAQQRASPEGREGLAAFFAKRKAAWVPK